MLRLFIAVLLLSSGAALAQQMNGHDPHDHSGMSHQHMAETPAAHGRVPTEAGQSAFAAIQEIVQILESDPTTDWSKANIEALRQHLIDMNNVTLGAEVTTADIDSGLRFAANGPGSVRDSIRRMVDAHAATMNGVNGWKFVAAQTEGGATLDVLVPPADLAKVKALGFIGVMTEGMHHQEHHLMLARGEHPHH